MSETRIENRPSEFGTAEITALSHLYRGELYRSTVWRTRLDTTTNWAVVTTGIALSLTFSSETASPLPLVLVGLLVTTFLSIEARRYRFFDFWRMRAHVLEVYFFGPILDGRGVQLENRWNEILYQDYKTPNLHITYAEAVGRRLRNNYCWIFAIQVTAYVGKLLIHPAAGCLAAGFLGPRGYRPDPGAARHSGRPHLPRDVDHGGCRHLQRAEGARDARTRRAQDRPVARARTGRELARPKEAL